MNDEQINPQPAIGPLLHGLMADFSQGDYPTMVHGVRNEALHLVPGVKSTAYGFVAEGLLRVSGGDGPAYSVLAGQYFCIPYDEILFDGMATALIVTRVGYVGLPMVGGPVENVGRLKYIDGCSDTIIVNPPVKGDPCLNLLHMPQGIYQTAHTHPTLRVGMVIEGEGVCHTPSGDYVLALGSVFILPPDALHAFDTTASEKMRIVAYHPDSTTGPSDEDHPMLNRTIVDGVSAMDLPDVQTKVITQ